MKMDKEIICTLGPASMNDRTISRLEEAGVNLFRINLSHTQLKDLNRVICFIQNRTQVPICLDTEGAQIRTGILDRDNVFLPENSIIRIPETPIKGNEKSFNFCPYDIAKELKVGDLVSIDFNSMLGQIIDKESDCIFMRVLTEGAIGSNKAVTIERDIRMAPLTKKDYKALEIGRKLGIRHVALSFANRASDVDEIRTVAGKDNFVISKIECINGIVNLEEIAGRSNALLIDRGDLARQVPIELVPSLQKNIIHRAKKVKAKIYVATNLLESMTKLSIPTRAEVNDIFNTLADGADGLVLAAETAIGSYPVNCAVTVSRIIKQFHSFRNVRWSSPKKILAEHSLLLLEPHGGVLVNRVNNNPEVEQIQQYKTLEVDQAILMSAEQIAIGTFSPLEGFMNKKNVDSVLKSFTLSDGVIWPIPIVLQISKDQASDLNIGNKVALVLKGTKEIYAVLHIEDIYSYDLDKMALETFQTTDLNHPGVQLLKERGNYFLGGKIELIKRLDFKYPHLGFTPRQARIIFESKGWSKIVGFHTRNVIHRVHEHIQNLAFEKYYCDGLFIHPAVGAKQRGDYTANIILKTYQLMVDKYYPKGKVVLAAFQNYSRYAGPREAVFTALCRKNFGCSHFIVGRDHTGLRKYYAPDAAQKLFKQLGDIGIVPIFFDEMYYCKKCNQYLEKCEHNHQDILNISGTKGRQMLGMGKTPPVWFMREDVASLILSEIGKNNKVFT